MAMLNDRDRHVLNDLERQLQQEDPAWVRQFKDPKPPRQARGDPAPGDGLGPGRASDRPVHLAGHPGGSGDLRQRRHCSRIRALPPVVAPWPTRGVGSVFGHSAFDTHLAAASQQFPSTVTAPPLWDLERTP